MQILVLLRLLYNSHPNSLSKNGLCLFSALINKLRNVITSICIFNSPIILDFQRFGTTI